MCKQSGIRWNYLIIMVVLLSAVVAGAIYLLYFRGNSQTPALMGTPKAQKIEAPLWEDNRLLKSDIVMPVGELVHSASRLAYEDSSMRLVIPRLSLDCPVLDGVDLPTLEHGPGLYEFAQTPDIYNTNVSIAAHRDLYGCEFYYLDTVIEGDRLYLVYKDMVFTYLYRSTEVVEPNNWDPIRCSLDSRITLTTCTPLGTSRQRMIVVGELESCEEHIEGFAFV